MSIGSIGSDSNWWYYQSQAAQATQATAGTTTTSSSTTSRTADAITNPGTIAANTSFASFLQAFSADIQTMLAQMGSAASDSATTTAAATATATGSPTTTTTTATASSSGATSQTASTQPQDGVAPHHHHHHSDGDQDDSMQTAANQLLGSIGQSLQGGSLSASGISNSASIFASDVMQAMQAYGSTTPTTSTLAAIA